MQMLPIESKQIVCVTYDDKSSVMAVYYHTGDVKTFPLEQTEYNTIMNATNKYDMLIQVTSGRNCAVFSEHEWN